MLLPRDKNSSVVKTFIYTYYQYYHKKHYTTLRHTLWAGLLLHDFFLTNFNLMRLENLHHSSNLRHNFWFNVVWHRPRLPYVGG